ncbi:ATP-binding cassette domain-containing protein [Corynebacterium sp. MSK151]|uniref:ATP-binding cassette domain-containing protein n=1 Tax=unclassified Corynebacterium TaxID=2624378 RepID=UPI00254ABD89|nr:MULTISPECIES: ATP-binding cassette domain-containing protein [unclassified Corynebacterium]MDK8759076.1 ATP-binding cassette domain-containing protein [Corynebacterium sp. MSK151]MDK8848210.1 ATP-binding cassette domain-containing protein [Corynebacterium sp. MSK047]
MVDLSFDFGTINAITGPVGCGKTSLAHLIAGLIPSHIPIDHAGFVHIVDADGTERPVDGDRVTFVGQDPSTQVLTLRVVDDVSMALEFSLVEAGIVAKQSAEALSELGLSELAEKDPWALSGGQRQRMAIAGAVARAPEVMIFDEPAAHVDEDGRRSLFAAIRDLRAPGRVILLIEHDLRPFDGWVDTVTILDADGSVAAHGAPEGIAVKGIATSAAPAGAPDASTPGTGAPDRPDLESEADAVPLLALTGTHVARGGERILDGADLTLERGEIHALVGANGAGKSTLLAVLSGQMKAGANFRIDGASARRVPDAFASWAFQNPEHQFTRATVAAEIDSALAGTDPHGPLGADELRKLREALCPRALDPVSPFVLSGGQKRRLGIFLAVAANRRLLLLDEPLAHLDSPSSRIVLDALAEYAGAGGTVVFTCHDRRVARTWADRASIVAEGKVAWSGPAADLPASPESSRRDRPLPAAGARTSLDESPWTSESAARRRAGLNAITIVAAVMFVLVAGLLSGGDAVLALTVVGFLALAAIAERDVRATAGKVLLVLLIGVFFGLLGWRSEFYGGGDASEAVRHGIHHGLLLMAVFAGTVLVSACMRVEELFDAMVQRLRVPYTWCTIAISGVSIAAFLRSEIPQLTWAIRLRSMRPEQSFRSGFIRATTPARIAFPLFVSAVRCAEKLSLTLAMRNFGLYPRRTFRTDHPWRVRDGFAAAASAAVFVAALVSAVT